MHWRQVGQPVRASSGTGPVAGGRAPATGCVTHSPESQLFELRAGRGGPTPPAAYPRARPAPPPGRSRRMPPMSPLMSDARSRIVEAGLVVRAQESPASVGGEVSEGPSRPL